MSQDTVSIHGIWASRWVFILAATGSAVGLGNIWKFPYMAGVYGGGAFVLVYLVCIALVGLPIMLAETVLGRRGRQSPVNTLRNLALQSGASARWSWAAVMGMVAALLILSFYSVVAGWSLDYIIGMGRGEFVGIDADGAGSRFGSLTADPVRLVFWHTLFMLVTAFIIARGVVAGLERSLRIMMPLLFVLLIILLGYSLTTGHFMQGVEFLFHFDLASVPEGILAAMGHAFFTLSVGGRVDHGVWRLYAEKVLDRRYHYYGGITGHCGGFDCGSCAVSDRFRCGAGALRRTGPDVRDVTDCVRQHFSRAGVRYVVLRAGRRRGLEFGHIDAGACGGLLG